MYSGLGFFTSFIGIAILMLHLFILLVTVVPLAGGPDIVSKLRRNALRLLACILASVLTIAVWSVLTKFTFEFSRVEIHFGLYVTMIGSFVATLYGFLLFQEERGSIHGLVHDSGAKEHSAPPPPSEEPEEYRRR